MNLQEQIQQVNQNIEKVAAKRNGATPNSQAWWECQDELDKLRKERSILEHKLNPLPKVTEQQLAAMDYVLSDDYDDD